MTEEVRSLPLVQRYPAYAFSPSSRYVGVKYANNAHIWSTTSGDLVYSFPCPSMWWSVNYGFTSHVPLASSPFPPRSQVIGHAANTPRPLSHHAPSVPALLDANTYSSLMTLDDAVFVLFEEDAAALSEASYDTPFSWARNGIVAVRNGFIKVGNRRLFWIHPSYSYKVGIMFESEPIWVGKGGNRILLGGKGGPAHVLDVGGFR